MVDSGASWWRRRPHERCLTAIIDRNIGALDVEGAEQEANLVRWRLHQVRKVYRQRLVKLGLASNETPPHVLVREPGAIDRLRAAC